MELPVRFPTEAEALLKQCQAEQHLSPTERLRAALEACRVVLTDSRVV
jgi:hypothetical protein